MSILNNNSSKPIAGVAWISVFSVLLGLLASLAWVTNTSKQARLQALSPEAQRRLTIEELDTAAEIEKQRAEVQKLRDENTRLQKLVASNDSASTELNKSLQDLKTSAGLTEVEGPGVTVVLTDSKRPLDQVLDANENIIHDQDVLSVINELWNAGAEAISINDKRIGPGSWVRCAGTRILVDSVQVAAPVVIRAIGDSKNLYNSMNMPGGYLDQLRQTDPAMVRIEMATKLNLPPFSGSTAKEILEEPKKAN